MMNMSLIHIVHYLGPQAQNVDKRREFSLLGYPRCLRTGETYVSQDKRHFNAFFTIVTDPEAIPFLTVTDPEAISFLTVIDPKAISFLTVIDPEAISFLSLTLKQSRFSLLKQSHFSLSPILKQSHFSLSLILKQFRCCHYSHVM